MMTLSAGPASVRTTVLREDGDEAGEAVHGGEAVSGDEVVSADSREVIIFNPQMASTHSLSHRNCCWQQGTVLCQTEGVGSSPPLYNCTICIVPV